ncbi:MAG: 30S ribosomal protein S13 [Candidatus Aenigmarchaeota archaeon]|nr:30S ribosomal protein S13 [Candidatus Aenigmarchaeota archaeon]
MAAAQGEMKKIVRIMATDIDGSLPVMRALRRIKGINFTYASAVCISAGIDKKKKLAELGADEIKSIEGAIKSPSFPSRLLNRRKDMETGKDVHLVGSGLDLYKREDINMMKKMRAYRGIRHELGLPVRGQRTRSSFRTQKTVGVAKKKIIAAAKPAAAAPAKPAAPAAAKPAAAEKK